ncbi:MAG: Ig-like domain-containing protein [Longimicrobiales bacterium]|nr:Ig-like domain-containing protein [Longimicrobiales bacterium]
MKNISLRTRAFRTSISALTVALLAWGCGDSPTGTGNDGEPASVTVAPGSATLVSLGDTAGLSATVRNASGGTLSTGVSWSSSDAGIAIVDTQGRVVAVANGTATVTATAGAANGTASITVQQAVDSLKGSGDAQSGSAGMALDSAVVVRAFDARGHPVAGAPVTFAILSGGGSVDPASGTTDATGEAATTWTLGTSSGVQELAAVVGASADSLLLSATALAMEPTAMAAYAGDAQTEIPGQPVPAPIQVRVVDDLGNGVPDVVVTFEVAGGAGDAALDSLEVTTDLDGVAGVDLTLGTSLGAYTVTAAAAVADSLDPEPQPLAGSPVVFGAQAVAFQFTPPDSVVVRDTVTLSGVGFHPDPASNNVTLGGMPVPVLDGTQSSLTLEIPAFGCTPQAERTLSVTRAGGNVDAALRVTPRGAMALPVGGLAVLSDPSDFCLQFLSGTDEEYLVGLTATRWFDASTTFALTGMDPGGIAPAPPRAAALLQDAGLRIHDGEGPSSGPGASPPEVEYALRAQEEAMVRDKALTVSPPPVAKAVTEGDALALRVPDLRGDACTEYLPVNVEVVYTTGRLSLATSAALPEPGTLAHSALVSAMDDLLSGFGATGVDILSSYLGVPQGWDGSTQVLVVLVPEVGALGVPAFAAAADQLPRATCPSSDEDHIVYVAIPQAASVTDFQNVLEDLPPELTHHMAHIVQWARRIPGGGNLLPAFLAEGQAEAAVERVGLALSGLWGTDEKSAAILGLPGVELWIPERFDRLSYFQGWNGTGGTLAGAPEGCSLFGFSGVCHPGAAPGAAWSFVRYVADRFDEVIPGGEDALQSALIDLDPSGDPLAEMEALLGIPVAELMVAWAAALQLDGRLTPAQAPSLQIPSWALESWLTAGGRIRHTPPEHPLAEFVRTGSVVGGGTAYTTLTTAGAHGPLAVWAADGAGGTLSPLLGPRLWVVRVR